jgi:hypothetical protein
LLRQDQTSAVAIVFGRQSATRIRHAGAGGRADSEKVSHFEIAPYCHLTTELVGGQLHISASPQRPWLVESLASDLHDAATLTRPWLQCVRDAPAVFTLPPGRGVTLASLWLDLTVDQRAGVTVSLLRTLLPVWPRSLFPLSAVLADERSGLSLVPPLPRCVEGASKTWSEWQFDDYPIGGMSEVLAHKLTFTLLRLLAEVPLTSLFSLRSSTPPLPSSRAAWLKPLDALTTEALEELEQKREPAADGVTRWAAALAVLEDQYQQSAAGSLGELVTQRWPKVDPSSRWGS